MERERLADALARLALPRESWRLSGLAAGEYHLPLPGWHEAGLVGASGDITPRGRVVARALSEMRALLLSSMPSGSSAAPLDAAMPALLAAVPVLLAARFVGGALPAGAVPDSRAVLAAVERGLLRAYENEDGLRGWRLTLAGAAFVGQARALAREMGVLL